MRGRSSKADPEGTVTGETRLERQAKRDGNGEPWEGPTKEGVSRRDGVAERKRAKGSCVLQTSFAKKHR